MSELTFSDFAKLANKRGLTPQCLAERFADKIERPGEIRGERRRRLALASGFRLLRLSEISY